MNTNKKFLPSSKIHVNDMDFSFSKEVRKRSGVDFNACYHCLSCSGGCNFSEIMDYLPNRVIRLVQLGLKNEALACSSIWVCVGCDTCGIQCPNSVDISTLMSTLSQMSLEMSNAKGRMPEPEIYKFHEEVMNSIKRYGRTHKLEIMLRYKIRNRDWFGDTIVGTKMFLKNKIELFPSKVEKISEVRQLF